MPSKIKIRRNVFLDTQVIISNNFQFFTKENLSRMIDLSKEDRLSLYFTQITIDEIRLNIINAVKDAEKAIKAKQFRWSVSVLYNYRQDPSFQGIFQRFDSDAIQAEILGQFEEYLTECQAQIISLNGISIENIFEKYFAKRPPFKDGRKKDEFPDAFAIAALELWCQKNDQKMYIISGDSDWKSACHDHQKLEYLEKPEALFQLLEFDDKLIEELADNFFNHYLREIEEFVGDQFVYLGFDVDTASLSIPIDNDTVDNVQIESIKLKEKYLIRVEETKLYFSCRFAVKFQAEVTYEDFSEAVYDKEEGRYYFGEWIQTVAENEYLTNVEVEIEFSGEDPQFTELTDVSIREEFITVYLEDPNEFSYK
jgi:hypothetical protein